MENGISDSKWLASMVVAAYTEERYDLGEALARLCGQAHRMERAAATLPAVPVDPAIYQTVPQHEPRHEPQHVQELVRTHEQPNRTEDACQVCGVAIGWLLAGQRWVHITSDGWAISADSPLTHDAVPAPAVNESNAPPAEETPTAVTPSGRCIAQGRSGSECHGVIYWAVSAAGLPAGWVHMDPSINGHDPVPNRPDPTR